jgi:hypothetical protein
LAEIDRRGPCLVNAGGFGQEEVHGLFLKPPQPSLRRGSPSRLHLHPRHCAQSPRHGPPVPRPTPGAVVLVLKARSHALDEEAQTADPQPSTNPLMRRMSCRAAALASAASSGSGIATGAIAT